MGEDTRDKQSSTIESKKVPTTQGWIRMHTDEKMEPLDINEQLDIEAQSQDRKTRREPEKQ
jgi:hypothetical protein